MKTFYYSLITITLFSGVISTFGQELKHYNLKGKVKSFHQIDYDVVNSFGELKKGKKIVSNDFNTLPQCDNLVTFNINGKETGNIHFKTTGDVLRKLISKRDIKGNVIEEIDLDKSVKYKYNEKGQIIEKTTYNSGGTIIPIKFKYDDSGNWIGYNQNGSIDSKEIFNNGNKIEKIDYDSDGNITYYEKYDENGKIIESDQPPNTNFYSRKYDNTGHEIQHIWKMDGVDLRVTTEYDINGNEIEIQYLNNIRNFTSIDTYKYKLDTHGNWVRMILYEDGKPTTWTERTIEYYP